MNNELQDVVKQADNLIRQGDFRNAWKLLIPFQNDPAARKRLVWLNQKRKPSQKAAKVRKVGAKRNRIYLFTTLIGFTGLSILVIFVLSMRKTQAPAEAGQSTPVNPTSTATMLTILLVTDVPPTEIPQEAGMQQQVRDWLMTVEGLTTVLALDIDVPGDQPPLVYAEIVVEPGKNDTHIPDVFMEKLNDVLNTTRYSDFVIIIDDSLQVSEYILDAGNNTWEQTELASSAASTPEPPTTLSGG